MSVHYDTIIIGAGIAGASIAHALKQKNQSILVLDKIGIASGASGAAAAFVSPKIGKGSILQTLTNEAFLFAKDFYKTHSPKHFHETALISIPKDLEDAEKFPIYEQFNTIRYQKYSPKVLKTLGIKSDFESFYFSDAGDCDAVEVCSTLLEGIEVCRYEVKSIEQKENIWSVGAYTSRHLILATGYENTLADLAYMRIGGIWGTRANFSSSLALPVSMHQSMSVSASRQGIIKLGATHERAIKSPCPCQKEQALKLKENAYSLINTSDLSLDKIFCGMRSGAKDYFPLIGKVIDVGYMLQHYPEIRKGRKVKLKHIPNLYVLNALGGRGFVFAPLMAKILSEHIVENKEILESVSPDRLFFKWCRKLKD
jgi:tRNA 5-methylaminomethyl-2-thiouridine biosynthesis bifunctional protein